MNEIPIFAIIIFFIGVGFYIASTYVYRKSEYGKQHKQGVLEMVNNKGNMGEYWTSRKFEEASFYNKLVFNCYLPKEEGKTTEIDLIALTERGIWVIENKNYHGWIFGDEKNKQWCQMLNKKKYFFFSPILQNKGHIKHLLKIIGSEYEKDIKSIIVFNHEAEIKKMNITSENVFVFESKQFKSYIEQEEEHTFAREEIDKLYDILMPYTKVTDAQKQEHIDAIKQTRRK